MRPERVYDYVIVGSGFGGSISAMRLAEKGYDVLVIERGRRFADKDFARSDWNVWRHLWLPALRCFGIWQNTLLNGIMILHGSGVGGGSLVYANVLMQPDDRLFAADQWRHLADWKTLLAPHFATARRMLGIAANPRLTEADDTLRVLAGTLGRDATFRPTDVAVCFDERHPGERMPDPYFGGAGPDRRSCDHCAACMVGCRTNAKNTLTKNYLYFAEKFGADIMAETTVRNIRPLPDGRPDGARYAVDVYATRAWPFRLTRRIVARQVILSAGAVNTNRLLLKCRDVHRSLPELSGRLGTNVRTNSESLTGVVLRDDKTNFAEGVCIGSIFQADDVTQMEPVRFPDGSGITLALLQAPMVAPHATVFARFRATLKEMVKHPLDLLHGKVFPGLARRSIVILTMQTEDNLMRVKLGRNAFTLFRKDLVCEHDAQRTIKPVVEIAHRVTRLLADKLNGIPLAMVNESVLNIPGTAHFMGGVPFGRNAADGVIGLNCEVHNYPGLYVVDGSIMPANPGVNPSLTIAALAEYAMAQMPAKPGGWVRPPMMVED